MADLPRVPNRQSTARDHLANERTFLAWVRTGLGVLGLGMVLDKVLGAPGSLDVLIAGAALGLGGSLLVIYGAVRYQQVRRALLAGEFLIARRGPVAVAIAAALLGLALAVWNWVTAR